GIIGTSSTAPFLTTGLTDLAATTASGRILVQNTTSGDVNITSLTDTDLTTGTNSATGLRTFGGNISIDNQAGTLSIAQAIVTTPTTAATAGGAVFLTAVDAITSTATTGTITTTGSATTANAAAETGGTGGEVLLRHTTAVANRAITLNAAIVA